MLIVSILIPVIGYIGLWVMGSALFLLYFRVFHIEVDLRNTVAMIRRVPVTLAIITVPTCSFVSFFGAVKLTMKILPQKLSDGRLLEIGMICVLSTVILDLLITVLGEKIDIMIFPVNLMYLLAWLVIVPSVLLAGH